MQACDLRGPFLARPARRLALRTLRHGQGRVAQDQAALDLRHRLFLRDQEERPHQDRQAFVQEIRSGRAQARRVQGNEDQVSGLSVRESRAPSRRPFYFEPLACAATPDGAQCGAVSLAESSPGTIVKTRVVGTSFGPNGPGTAFFTGGRLL